MVVILSYALTVAVVVMCCRPNEAATLSQHESIADARDFAARVPCTDDGGCAGDHLIGWYESGHYCVDFTISPTPKPLSVQLLKLYPRPDCVPPVEFWARPPILNQPFGHYSDG
jgi:hypothetical protein